MVRRLCYFILVLVFFAVQNLFGQNCDLHPPDNLSVSNITSCSVTLNWHSSIGVKNFKVSYRKTIASPWAANINVDKNTSFTFTGLSAKTKYKFRVFSSCTDGTHSAKEIISATTSLCSLPSQVSADSVSSNSFDINVVTSCPFDSLRIRYSTFSGVLNYAAFVSGASYIVDGLLADTSYLFQVSTCPLSANSWTSFDTVQTAKLPNIILILLDDSRFNYFSCNGAPAFFQTPSIDRIANEGVNFKNSYCVTSLCAPSRATIATGLFTLKTGVTQNGISLDTSFKTVPKILRNNGYYTALVGKNHGTFLSGNAEFNYFLWSLGIENNAGIKFNYNGTTITIAKNNSLTLTDTAIAVIKRVNQPLFLWLSYQAPHFPLSPLESFSGRYDSYVIPWLPDTAQYTVNYPSPLYSSAPETLHGIGMDTLYRQTLEVIGELDSCVGVILNMLESTGKLDNTLLIFTDDNGYMLGNHWVRGKTYAYEASARVPLFIRYPKWFANSTVITNQLVSNVDLAPTMYDAAQVPSPVAMDGFSLKKIYDGTADQKAFYYIMLHDSGSLNPSTRSFRDLYYKYVHYSCTEVVEEFFDMVNDPLELTNLINNSAYASLIQVYRGKYDSMRLTLNDTAVDIVRPCSLTNPYILREQYEADEFYPAQPVIYPKLTDGLLEIYMPWSFADAILYDDLGRMYAHWKITGQFTNIHLPQLSGGLYLLNLRGDGHSVTEKFVVPLK